MNLMLKFKFPKIQPSFMKWLKLLTSALLFGAIFYGLNSKFGQIPPLGKFLSPNQGIWQNDFTEDLNGQHNIEGLSGEVKILYDQELIPHIFAQNELDLYRTQGYVTAQNRLWQMEFQTHAAAGRLSEIIGAPALNYDREQRRKGMLFGADNALKAMNDDPEVKSYIEAYAEGVNAYISSLKPEKYPIEYKLLDYAPENWSIKKTALLLMYMTDMLAGGENDLEFSNLVAELGKDQFDFLFPDFFDAIDPVIPKERDWSNWEVNTPEVPEGDYPVEPSKGFMTKPHPDNGSNNWAIGPDKSLTGNPILANDPHLGLNLPSIWYVMQLSTPEKKVFGATLPGALGVISGFNENISWGVTNATRDVKDWYQIKFRDDLQDEYWHDEEWKQTSKRIEEIKIKGADTYYDSITYTHHGPVSYDASYKGNGRQHTGHAMKWIGHEGGNNQRTFVELNKAKNYDDYVNALTHYIAPAQNFVFSSTEGDIALWVNGKFPNKWEEQGKFYMDGSNPEHDWQGFIPHEHNAHVLNPERGFVSSANQHPVDEKYPYYVFNDGYDMTRSRVINDFFRSKEEFGLEDFIDLHNNNYNLLAAELVPIFLSQINAQDLSVSEQEVLEIVQNWDFNNNMDQQAPTIFQKWWPKVRNSIYDELDSIDVPVRYPFTYRTYELLRDKPEHELMDIKKTPEVETAADLILLGFRKTVEEITEMKAKGESINWVDYKQTYAGHLLQGLPAFSRFNIPIGGNSGIVNATSKNHGPSWRMIVEMSSPPKALGIYPGGQSGNPGSKFYDNMIERWAAGEYIELNFMQEPVESEAMFVQTLTPQK